MDGSNDPARRGRRDDPEDQRFEDERHCIGLLRDLAIKGPAEERVKGRSRGEEFGLTHLEFRISAAGLSLHLGTAPPDPDIDDDRV